MTKDELNTILEKHASKGIGCGVSFPEGWTQLLVDLHNDLVKIDPDYIIDQVKEKFGSLRFYLQTYLNDEVRDTISKYENKSTKVCCVSGKKATHYTSGWLRFYNEEHAPSDAVEMD